MVGYTGFRRPKTTQERRRSIDPDALAFGIKPRAKRFGHNLRNAWDDIPRSDDRDRSWKRHRRCQCKAMVSKDRILVVVPKVETDDD